MALHFKTEQLKSVAHGPSISNSALKLGNFRISIIADYKRFSGSLRLHGKTKQSCEKKNPQCEDCDGLQVHQSVPSVSKPVWVGATLQF
ncbi:MAG: hypothetical protein WBO55_16435 [Rhizobiaceae bacterium]